MLGQCNYEDLNIASRRSTGRVFDTGVAGAKVFYSVEEDRVKFEQATVHDFFCDTQSGQNPKWVVFETLISKDES